MSLLNILDYFYANRQNYLRFSNSKTKRIYTEGSPCTRTGFFVTEDNAVEVIFALEDFSGGFSIKYSAGKPSPKPVKFELGTNATWFYAMDLCRSKGFEICT